MESFFTILPILIVTIGSTLSAAEWGRPFSIPLHHNPETLSPPSSGPRLRRQYPGGPFQYSSPSDQYTYSAPIIPKTSASARALASYLASSDDEEDYVYCPPNHPRKNKRFGMKFVQEALGNKITANLENYLLPTYIQHNPTIADGIEPFRTALLPGGLLFGPKVQIDFRHVGADGDLVWFHTRRVRPNGDVFANFDLFRFECGKIAEHWDIIQNTELTTPAANDHPFF